MKYILCALMILVASVAFADDPVTEYAATGEDGVYETVGEVPVQKTVTEDVPTVTVTTTTLNTLDAYISDLQTAIATGLAAKRDADLAALDDEKAAVQAKYESDLALCQARLAAAQADRPYIETEAKKVELKPGEEPAPEK